MDRDLLSTIPVGISAGLEIAGPPEWGLLGSQILAETATGTHGPGALYNDGLTPSLRYVPVLLTRSAPAFILFPNGSFEGPNPSSATYALYESGTGRVLAGDPGVITIAAPAAPATVTIRLVDSAVSGAALPDLAAIQWGWWDNAADEAETRGVAPTASGNAESTDATGALQLSANSTKSSGQTVLIKLYQHGYPPRAFTGLLTVD
jgi:hypothetical protein